MTTLNSLFDDWDGDGEITHSSSSKDAAAKIITKLWKLWCLRTEREDAKKEPRELGTTIRKALNDGISESELEHILEGAARTEPRNRDPQDTRRLTTAISNPKIRKFALAALNDDLPIQTNPAHQQKMTVREVENVLETNREDWGEDDMESAITLTEKYTPDELIERADKVALIVGQVALFPSEILRHSRQIETNNFKVKKNDKRGTYAAGAVESARAEDINFYADRAADNAFNKNVPIARILAFHNEAPEGYWDAVSKSLRGSKLTPDAIYSSLEERFGWNPNQREPIAKVRGRHGTLIRTSAPSSRAESGRVCP